MADADFAVAVFPFLKTSAPTQIGGYIFRSTMDVEGLPPDQTKAVGEIAQMLLVQNDLRVKSCREQNRVILWFDQLRAQQPSDRCDQKSRRRTSDQEDSDE